MMMISLETIPWNLLFCLSSSSSSDSTCIGGEETTVLKPNQKVNIIPGMRILFGRKDFSCQTLSDMRKIPCKFFCYSSISLSLLSSLFLSLFLSISSSNAKYSLALHLSINLLHQPLFFYPFSHSTFLIPHLVSKPSSHDGIGSFNPMDSFDARTSISTLFPSSCSVSTVPRCVGCTWIWNRLDPKTHSIHSGF